VGLLTCCRPITCVVSRGLCTRQNVPSHCSRVYRLDGRDRAPPSVKALVFRLELMQIVWCERVASVQRHSRIA
jgi:hypothetical protein